MKKNAKVSIIIVNYNVYDEVLDCIKSILIFPPTANFEVIVVDNSQDTKLEHTIKSDYPPLVKYIKSQTNIGYGRANNLGAKNVSGDYLFILNPDTTVTKGAIDELINF